MRVRDFRLFFTGRVLLFMSFQVQSVAIGWELYDSTGSALALGLVGLVQFLPVLVFTLLVGHLADRYNHKRTIAVVSLAVFVFPDIRTLGALHEQPSETIEAQPDI